MVLGEIPKIVEGKKDLSICGRLSNTLASPEVLGEILNTVEGKKDLTICGPVSTALARPESVQCVAGRISEDVKSGREK